MQPKIRLETTEFKRTLAQYMRHTKRDLADVLNGWSYDVARQAVKLTKKTSEGKINRSLNKRANVKRGKQKRPPLAAVIVNSRRRRGGYKGLYGEQMREAIEKLKAARRRAIGSLKVGWFPAIAIFGRKISKGNLKIGGKVLEFANRPRGGGKVASPGWRSEAQLWNESFAKKTSNADVAEGHVTEGLRRALAKVVLSKKRRLERKLQKTANRYSARR